MEVSVDEVEGTDVVEIGTGRVLEGGKRGAEDDEEEGGRRSIGEEATTLGGEGVGGIGVEVDGCDDGREWDDTDGRGSTLGGFGGGRKVGGGVRAQVPFAMGIERTPSFFAPGLRIELVPTRLTLRTCAPPSRAKPDAGRAVPPARAAVLLSSAAETLSFLTERTEMRRPTVKAI